MQEMRIHNALVAAEGVRVGLLTAGVQRHGWNAEGGEFGRRRVRGR